MRTRCLDSVGLAGFCQLMSGRESLAGELTASLMVATGGRSSTTLQFTVSLPGGIHHEINHLDRISRQSSRSPRSWRWQFGYQKMMPRVEGAAASQGENPVHPRSDLIRGVDPEFGCG